jgi:NADH-quinone oxidoreductase subunit L
LWLPAAPFLAAALGIGLGRSRSRLVVPVAVAGTTAALVLAIIAAVGVAPGGGLRRDTLATAVTGGPSVVVGSLLDGLASSVAVMVAVVALLVQVYSIAYLRGDPRYPSYAAVVSLFTAAMMLVVVSADLLVLFVGWEVMGICSSLLIGHHWEQEDARVGAVKAFIVTRIGDVLLLLGVLLIGLEVGTFAIPEVLAAGPSTAALLLLLGGVVGKSAQFPLHVWLPDAMPGPTPVSALIHAATMVAAGVYLVARLWPAYAVSPVALATLATIGAITMLGAALAACAQDDLKRVLAWSTVSQLGYLTGALGVGAYTAGVFHLLSHAAFKALLFLAAGSVMHAVGTTLMRDMGGLRRAMPVTFVTMTLGMAALAGLPPFAGFFSKEAVLSGAEDLALHGAAGASAPGWAGWLVLVSGLVTVAVTGAYATRAWCLTFLAHPRGVSVPHEAPPAMRWPLVVLAVPTVGLGFAGLSAAWLPTWVRPALPGAGPYTGVEPEALVPHPGLALLSVGLAVTGSITAYAAWRLVGDPALRLGRLRPVLAAGFGVDALYSRIVVRPTLAAARAVRWGDDNVVDTYVQGSGVAARLLGIGLRLTQNGNLQGYLTGVLAGATLLAVGAVVLS